jgi:hypothetical protein
MNSFVLNTPVVMFVFNRPAETERVFAEIREARPPRLLIVADGPRADCHEDGARCEEVRLIVEQVDWPCEVQHNYSDVNLGCRKRVASGLDWVFGQVEEAIFLEDDCLPQPSFFRFCEELLTKYRHDERIMMISGDNFQFGLNRTSYSYYFSRYSHIWGWASWRRSWEKYDSSMKLWPEIRDGGWLQDVFTKKHVVKYWEKSFDDTYNGLIDTWDHQFTFACMVNNGLSVVPKVNLVSNIGFNFDASRTKKKSRLSNMETGEMLFPLIHPLYVIRNALADKYTEDYQFSSSILPIRLLRRYYYEMQNMLKKY